MLSVEQGGEKCLLPSERKAGSSSGTSFLRCHYAAMGTTSDTAVTQGSLAALANANGVVLGGVLVGWPLWHYTAGIARVLLMAVLVLAGVVADRVALTRRGGRATLAVAMAVATAGAAGIAAGVLASIGWWLWLGALLAVVVVHASWWARGRALSGRWNGPAVVTAVQVAGLLVCLRRPWSPHAEQWSPAAAGFAAAALLSLVGVVLILRPPSIDR
ncbi:MAG: hypothetical protein JWL79_2955 [Frankiales bacterium]|nr:hypothetical protein [Frankiales bacterium]